MDVIFKTEHVAKCNTLLQEKSNHDSPHGALLPKANKKVNAVGMRRAPQAEGKSRKPVKVWLVLLWLTMVLNLVACSDTMSPTLSFRSAEPEVTRKPSDVSQCATFMSLPFMSFRQTWSQTNTKSTTVRTATMNINQSR